MPLNSRKFTIRNNILTIFIVLSFLTAALVIYSGRSVAETVVVKYRGPVDLTYFECEMTKRSSFIRQLCYDDTSSHVVVKLNSTWYEYCGITQTTLNKWMSAGSMGRFYNATIKGNYRCD
jgi:hypothetical protein